MFERTISTVMIAAIIACPLWCGNGSCFAGQCCTVEKSADNPCEIEEIPACCLHDCSAESNDEQPIDCPEESPCKLKCQGVCGGAVLEKPIELDDSLVSVFLPLVVTHSSVSSSLTECSSKDRASCLYCGSSHGRSLRTLYQSFLI